MDMLGPPLFNTLNSGGPSWIERDFRLPALNSRPVLGFLGVKAKQYIDASQNHRLVFLRH